MVKWNITPANKNAQWVKVKMENLTYGITFNPENFTLSRRTDAQAGAHALKLAMVGRASSRPACTV
jgi:hypothetical protein